MMWLSRDFCVDIMNFVVISSFSQIIFWAVSSQKIHMISGLTQYQRLIKYIYFPSLKIILIDSKHYCEPKSLSRDIIKLHLLSNWTGYVKVTDTINGKYQLIIHGSLFS